MERNGTTFLSTDETFLWNEDKRTDFYFTHEMFLRKKKDVNVLLIPSMKRSYGTKSGYEAYF